MKLKYDKQADAIYIYFSDAPYAYGKDLDTERRVDYAIDGTPRGVELLCVSDGVNVDDLPRKDEIAEILEINGIKAYTTQGYSVTEQVFDDVDLSSSSFREKEEVTA